MDETPQEVKNRPQKADSKKPKEESSGKMTRLLAIFMVLFMVATAALGGLTFILRSNANKQQSAQQAEIDKLDKDKTDLLAQLEKAKSDLKKAKSAAATSSDCTDPTASDLENIKASITSGNTAALEGYMADSVNVIYAASEGVGAQTPTQAIADLKYVSTGTNPWNFSLPSATISGWASGDYATYISTDDLIGKSANNNVVVFGFNCSGKISDIFMTNNANLL